MNSTPLGQLVLMWWNTSLSPPVPDPGRTEADVNFAISHIKKLRCDYQFDLLGLCEVSSEDLRAIIDGVGDPYLAVADETDRSSRLKIDTAIIYDRRKLEKVDSRNFIDRYGNETFKAGTLVSFLEPATKSLIHVVVSHWPGRQSAPEHSAKRAKLGQYLCQEMRKLKEVIPDPYIVLMGDYNDDPFAESLASHLLATRDRELARSNGDFFYNPFWRCIGESAPSPESDIDSSICGTHYYRSGTHSKWFTYDQIIFSSSFLKESGVAILDEKHSQITATSDLRDLLLSYKSIFDHFPVQSIITLRANHG